MSDNNGIRPQHHLRCPQCHEINVVAGYYSPPCRDGQRSEGIDTIVIRCGFCGTSFQPQQVENK